MKKYLFGFIAIIAAIASFAFTRNNINFQSSCNSSTTYAWFHVTTGQSVTSCSTSALSGKIDLSKTEYTNTPSLAIAHFGCPSSGSFVCIVAYALTDVTTDGSGNFIPKPAATPVCCIFRVTNS